MQLASQNGEKYALLEESQEYAYGGKDYNSVSPVTLTWEKINVFAPAEEKRRSCFKFGKSEDVISPEKRVRKQILHDVNGIVTPGTLLAIMGASGAGKTTLMNVLTGRSSDKLVTEGQVRVNGRILGDDIKYTSAYVQQEDHFINTLTVREHLTFQAALRLDQSMPESLRKKRVDDTIAELNMGELVNTRIGLPGQGKGLSGGERKRLTFATEVLTNPPLVFCDEPTSGLDSYMARTVMETLRNLAARGRTILCTIHQPSSEVYSFMDRLCLMAEGRLAFIGTSESVDTFFSSVGYKCPTNYNPPDFYIHTLAIIPGREDECRKRVKVICDEYQDSADYLETRKQIARLSDVDTFIVEMSKVDSSYSKSKELLLSKADLRYKASRWTQMRLLFWRCWTNNVRDPSFYRSRIYQMLILGVLMAFLYNDQEYNQTGVQNINGAFFIFLFQFTFCNANLVINGITRELDLFFREHNNGIYRVETYFITYVLSELLAFVLTPILFTLIVYWIIGLFNTPEAVFTFMLTLILMSIATMAFGHLLSTATTNVTLALIITPSLISPLLYFAGFYLNLASIPDYLKPLQYLSWFRYANEVLVCNQWKDVQHIACETASPIYADDSNGTSAIVGYDTSICYTDGQSVIDSLSFNSDNIPLDLGLLFVMFVVFETISYGALYYHSRKRQ